MRPRFPIYTKVLVWFFLNLILLAAACSTLFRAQFRFAPDWLLSGSANQRIEALSDLIVLDLNDRPRSEWNGVLQRFNRAYRLEFSMFRGDGMPLAGETVSLPPEVRQRLPDQRGQGPIGLRQPRDEPGLGPLPRNRPGLGPPPWRGPPFREAQPGLSPPMPQGPRGPHPKFMLHTANPSRYWVLVRLVLNEPGQPRPMPATLLAMSDSLSGGGLFFDVRPWLALGMGAVVFSALLWLPLLRGMTRSISQLTEATRQIAEGRFDVRVNAARRDELGLLGQAVNQMAARLAGFVSGQKRFLGDVAHELCSPLARLQVALGILDQRVDDKQKPYVEAALDKAQHIAGLVNELLSFSKASLGPSTIQPRPCSVRAVIAKAVGREAVEGMSIQVEVPEDLHVMAEPELLLRSLSNLLRNAIRYAGSAGPITVSATRDGDVVVVRVADCGPGVSESDLARIFDPFYRVDASRDRATGGVGLGLAIVKTCVESCHGTVSCRNRSPSGLEVTIQLPSAASVALELESLPLG